MNWWNDQNSNFAPFRMTKQVTKAIPIIKLNKSKS